MDEYLCRKNNVQITSDPKSGKNKMISVLYVDDETSLLEVTKIYIERSGEFSVDTTPSALTALMIMDTRMYDAIISDYQMPEMDGIEFLKKVRSSGNSIPFIIFTGKGREEVVIEALNAGADFYIQKGGDPRSQFTELAHKVRQAVQQRSADMRIRDLEQRETDILNFLPDATFAIERTGHVIAWNKAVEEMTGIPAAGMLGRGDYAYGEVFYGCRRPILIDLVFEPDAKIAEHYSSIRREGAAISAESEISLLKGGAPLVVLAKASPLYDKSGRVTGAIESIRDITDRKRAEDALRESGERYRRIVETSLEGIWIVDAGFRITFTNTRMAQMLGYLPEEMAGQPVSAFIPPGEIPHHRHVQEGLIQRTSQQFERRYLHKTGAILTFLASMTPVTTDDGTFQGAFAMFSDITDRKHAETALRESEQRLGQIIDFLPDPTFAVDRDGRVIAWNYAMEMMTGTKAAEMTGKGDYEYALSLYGTRRPVLIDLVHSPPDEIRAHYDSVNIEQDRLTAETKDASPGGKHLVLHESASALYGADGAVNGAIETIHDITARRMLQDALTTANRKLNLLSQITRHDIVNRISVCLGFIELAKEESADPRMNGHIANIEKTIGDIRRQIGFTRLYQDLGVNAPVWQDVEEILSQCHSRHGIAAMELGGAEVYADSMLPKVFSNLMDNTLRYGGEQVKVTVRAAEREGALVISWEDTGAGVPADEKEKIFERGYGKNTGLGLFLAREILGITGITIREAGEPGKGARFEITVPPGAYRYRE